MSHYRDSEQLQALLDLAFDAHDEDAGSVAIAEPEIAADESQPPMAIGSYAAAVQAAFDAWIADQSPGAALRLAKAVIHAALDAADSDTGVLISNSWGKDSSALLGIYCDVVLERQASGRRIPFTMVVTADTGSEFPDMLVRTEEEGGRLTEWARSNGLPIECHVVRPSAKDGLLANLIGGGRPLPKYANSKSAGTSEWCVDRLKVGPIARSIRLAKGRCGKLLHFLGVRTEESTKRAATIARNTSGLPFGLTRLSMLRRGNGEAQNVVDESRIGIQPIVHWSHEDLTTYMRITMAPWNAFSFESLKEIYRKAAGKDDVNGAGECRISLTKDGGVTNTCSDLSGSRLGCLLCVKARNLSLQHYAAKDRRYRWVRAAHRYIYNGIRQHQLRMKDIRAAGWDRTTLFPKTYLFSWRVKLLALVYRAELEDGIQLITPETEQAIVEWWHRSGVFTVTPADIKADVVRWIETNRLRFSYEADAANYESLSLSLSEGLPGGVYAHELYPNSFRQSLEVANLMSLAGRGNGFYPHLKAYVFQDLSSRGGYLTMLTDTPSDMGRRVNTDALNGFSGFALELVGVRDVTTLEKRLLRGRTFFYRTHRDELAGRVSRITGTTWEPGQNYLADEMAGGLNEIMMANMNLLDPCGEKEFIDHLFEGDFITTLRGDVTVDSLRTLLGLISEAADLSDSLSTRHEMVHRRITVFKRHLLDKLGSDRFDAGDAAARKSVQEAVSDGWRIKDFAEDYKRYVDLMRAIAERIRKGEANTELVNRLAYVARTDRYDPAYAEEKMAEVVRLLGGTDGLRATLPAIFENADACDQHADCFHEGTEATA